MRDNFFGQPAAFNRWFGDDLIIPPATGLLLPNYPQAPAPPAIPGSQPGRNLPPTGQGDPGADQGGSGYDTSQPAQIGPGGTYSNTGYDQSPSVGKLAQALTSPVNPFSAFTAGLVDPAAVNPFSAAKNAFSAFGDKSGPSGPDASANPSAPTIGEQYGHIIGAGTTGTGSYGAIGSENSYSLPGTSFSYGISDADVVGMTQAEAEAAQTTREDGLDTSSLPGGSAPGEGPDSATVLCTALYHHGLMPHEVWEADAAYGAHLDKTDPDVRRGYLIWAKPIARLMERNRTFAALMSVLVLPWAHEIYGNTNWLGRFYLRFGVPLCRTIGRAGRCLRSRLSAPVSGQISPQGTFRQQHPGQILEDAESLGRRRCMASRCLGLGRTRSRFLSRTGQRLTRIAGLYRRQVRHDGSTRYATVHGQ